MVLNFQQKYERVHVQYSSGTRYKANAFDRVLNVFSAGDERARRYLEERVRRKRRTRLSLATNAFSAGDERV